MAYLLLLVAMVVAAWLLWPILRQAAPAQIVRGTATVVLIVAAAVGGFALVTGRPTWVVVALIVGLASLILRYAAPAGAGAGGTPGGRRGGRSRKGGSTIRTRYLDMTLDHATGSVSGDILSGRHAGRRVEEMTTGELVDVLREASVDDPQSAQLLEAYLDRVAPDWRDAAGAGADDPGRARGPAGRIRMTREEALRVLGLGLDATDADVRAAHRKLMREHHPDRGGDSEFAAKLNEAKEVLLGSR